ncbi:TetR/AcrR family transcriptional regulator [Actinomadura sp. LOL_016]|uniref:TetR/AcrR family transcriptional regulator n=1 Tax=unclassified Actinomadura TaxID=2626254 RepID=UPI003A812716
MTEPAHPSSPRRGRPPKITRARIIEAVLAEGFAGLTVPAVAERLGVTTMTLYRHAATRSDLLAMAWDHVLEQHTWPDFHGPWRDLLHRHATALWDLLAEHPGAVTELSGIMSARMVGLYDDLATALTGHGFTAFDAVLATDTVIDLAVDHRRGVENLARTTEGDAETSLHDQISGLWTPERTDAHERRTVRTAMSHVIMMPPREWFGHKLELFLDGLTMRHRTGTPHDARDA